MPTLSVGRTTRRRRECQRRARCGVTLLELVIVATLLGFLAAISYPSLSAGIDSLRITAAADATSSFLNSALNRAERRQHPVEIAILPAERSLQVTSAEPGFVRQMKLPDGVGIVAILPAVPLDEGSPRRFLIYPGGTVPRIGIVLANQRGARRTISVDPITGVPVVERGQQ